MNENIMKFFDLKVGDKLIYGINDKENAIDCTFININEVLTGGQLVIKAECDGGTIIALDSLFTIV